MKTIKTYDTFTKTYTTVEVDDEIANAMELFDALEKEDDIAYWKAQKSAERPWYFKGYTEDDYVGDIIKEFLEDNSIEELQEMAPETIDLIVDMLFPDIDPMSLTPASEIRENHRAVWGCRETKEIFKNPWLGKEICEFIPRSKSKVEILAKVGEETYNDDRKEAKQVRRESRMEPRDLFNEDALEIYSECVELKLNARAFKNAAVSHNGDTEEDAEARRTYMGEYRKLAKQLERKYMKFKIADSTMDVFSYDMSTSHEIPRNEQYEDYFEHADWEWEKLMAFKESNKESYRSRTWSEGQKALAREKRLNDYRGLVNPPRFIRLNENDMIIRRKNYTKAQYEAGIKKLERQRAEERNKPRFSNLSVDSRAEIDSWFKAMQVK